MGNPGEGKTYIATAQPVVKTVTLELVGPLSTCENCVFASPSIEGCPALSNGDPALDCNDNGYWRVKDGAA